MNNALIPNYRCNGPYTDVRYKNTGEMVPIQMQGSKYRYNVPYTNVRYTNTGVMTLI